MPAAIATVAVPPLIGLPPPLLPGGPPLELQAEAPSARAADIAAPAIPILNRNTSTPSSAARAAVTFLRADPTALGHTSNQLSSPVLGCNAVSAGIPCVSSGWITHGGPISPDTDRDPMRGLIVIRQPPRRNSGTNAQAHRSATEAADTLRIRSLNPASGQLTDLASDIPCYC